MATTAGDGAPGKIRKRLNYKPVSHYEIYFTLCNAAHVKKNVQKRLSGKKVNKLLNFTLSNIAGLLTCLSYPFFSAKKVTHKKIELSYITSINELRNELDRFWEDNKACFGITIDRSSHFLQWRIFENPNINYTFIAAKQEETLVGYIILKKTHGRLDYGVIEDIVAKDLSIDIYLSLLQEAKNYCNKEHYAAIIFPTLSSNSRLKTFSKKGVF
ncbi:hypothetical protein Loa_02089 [Legionella oakridgensis ATCC 33761 = DSM 21215]|uniref:N-acetyltransferase domain-containing protein n=1 Tax=Legionella oakridgensis ATCC 33761 = DSM 21215 TaxID=1268635 RepID=W0BAR0_9GAMM|nr:GNAT family N-acetyltransferase [Legionella oakridgensis]AHE67633.1 hypothetical protein Loa_02089 [Legionella oakridgensis ATCC 33761 = DSM 21215]